MRMTAIVTIVGTLALSTASAPAESPQNPGRDRALATIEAADMEAHIRILASDDFGGRAPATPGETKTLAYLTGKFAAFGVTPPPGGNYLQDVPLVRKTVKRSTHLEVRGKGKPLRLVLGESMNAGTGGAADRVVIEDCDLVFVGYGIVAEEQGWNDYDGVDVTGKTVIVLMNDPAGAADSLYFKGRALSNYGVGSNKGETAARHGARGVLFIHDPDIVGYPYAALMSNVSRPRFERVRDAQSAPVPEFWSTIPREMGAAILARAGQNLDDLSRQASQRGFHAVPLGLKLKGEIDVSVERSMSHNVVGYVPGSERPDEYVVYTAHWDHVGIGTPVNGDSIYNGAVDNATGTAALLELAQAFTSLPKAPRRSVVFIATTAEEQGLLGSYDYADHPVFPLERTIAEINMDALFPFDDWNGMTVVAMGSSELEDYLRTAAAAMGRKLEADPAPEQGAFFRSDHYPFAKKGVPAIFAVGGPLSEPEPSKAVMDRFTDYITNRYHRPSDELGDDWDFRGIVGDTKIYFLTGYDIANDDRVPNWYLDSEFRALRDRQRESSRVVGGN
jgi:Zn-dependent M28 family amino/carboxypeptidase